MRWSRAASPLEALLTVHRDASGPGRVRMVKGELVFADPAEQNMCTGRWRVSTLQGSTDG